MQASIGLVPAAVLWLAPSLWAAQEVLSHSVWERHLSATVRVDQEQLKEGVISGGRVGQVFTPRSDWLERLDVITKNRTDLTPGKIRLWPWLGDAAKTTAQKPLWEDDLDFSGQDAPVLRHYFPRVSLTPGRQYYFECSREGENFYVAGVEQDAYPAGFAVTHGGVRKTWDLWFRTFSRRAAARPVEAQPLPPPAKIQARAPRPARPVTKQVYLDTIQALMKRSLAGWRHEAGKHSAHALFYLGFLTKATGDRSWGAEASAFIRGAEKYFFQEHPQEGTGFRFLSQFGHGVRWLQEAGVLAAEDLAVARKVMVEIGRRNWPHRERGAMNRSLFQGLGYDLLTRLCPDVPEAAQWKSYAALVWHDWADFLDTNEDSAHYNAVSIDALIPWIRLTGQTRLFDDPRLKRLVSNFRDVLTPQGAMPSWGDSLLLGADWGAYVALFEMAAAITRDGTYKWAAHRVLDHHRRYLLPPKPGEDPLLCAYEDLPNLVWAWLEADETVQPVPPRFESKVLTATATRRLPIKERKEKGLDWFELLNRQSPWKLVMRDGADENAWYALWGLRPWGGHGHADAPALICLSADGTVLTHDTAYFDKRVEDHNMLYGIRVRGGTLGHEKEDTEVRRFVDQPAFTYADIAWYDYPGWGARFRREVLFVKGLGWWVRDRTDVEHPAEWYLGPIWHADRLRSRGPSWFDVDYPAPNSFAWPLANGTGHLLIYFTPRSEAVVDHADFTHQVRKGLPWYSSLPWAVYQMAGPLKFGPDKPVHFNSLLLPLRQADQAAAVAQGIEVLGDEPGATILRLRKGPTTWTLALQNDGRQRAVGPVNTDAVAVVVREESGAKPAVSEVKAAAE